MDLIQECQYDHRCLRIGIDGCAVHVRPSMGGETSAAAVERLRAIIQDWHQEQVAELQARVAELEAQLAAAQGDGRAIWPNGATDRDGDWLEDER